MSEDVRDFIMRCYSCQRVNPTSLKVVSELKSLEIPKQVGTYVLCWKIYKKTNECIKMHEKSPINKII